MKQNKHQAWGLLLALMVVAVAGVKQTLAETPAPNAIVEVTVFDIDYDPDPATIEINDTIRWRNIEGFHNVISDDGLFNSGAASSDPWTFDFTFTEPGNYSYFCSVHGAAGGIGMSGVVKVPWKLYLPTAITNN